jgi:hypothetical protein
MAFSYYTVYRTEGADPEYARLTAAAQYPEAEPGTDTWIFWFAYNDNGPPYRVLQFESLKKGKGGEVIAKFEGSDNETRFIPLTPDFVRKHPEKYGVAEPELSKLTQGDIFNLFHSLEVGDDYEEWVGPSAEALTREDEENLSADDLQDLMLESVFFEMRGVEADVGAKHKWKDGTYEKQPDHSWRKIPAEYASDSHPSIPASTRDAYFDKVNRTWSPERKKLHKDVLDKRRAQAFDGLTPVPPDQKPVFTFMMGPPAAGKSVRRDRNEFHNSAKLDPDAIVVMMPEFIEAQNLKVRSGASSVAQECSQLNDVLVDEAMESRFNFVVEGTGSKEAMEWMASTFFPALKKKGYSINIVMAYVEDLDELLLRAEERGERTGRFVDPARTEKLHAALPKNLKKLMDDPNVDTLAVMNTHYAPKPGEPMFKPVYMQTRKDGESSKKAVQDPEFFDRMMVAADEP